MKFAKAIIATMLLSLPLAACAADKLDDENTVESSRVEEPDQTASATEAVLSGCSNAEIRKVQTNCNVSDCRRAYGAGVGSRGIHWCDWRNPPAPGFCFYSCACSNGKSYETNDTCPR
ncbi:hypothetical protein [Pendulispora albinea]|uniref:Secreted protein n=1 Tax=Pendulispora albinea TaxID=2741071 RepID=A0ABZ2M0E8_9BACT